MDAQPIRYPSVADIQNFFFDAALATYAGNAPKTTVPELPGSKRIIFHCDELLYDDVYFTNGEYSGGSTVISHLAQPKPVNLWLMQYHGWCKNDDPEVLTFLKATLRAAYEKRTFHGGRGYRFSTGELPSGRVLHYFNTNNGYGSSFNEFGGTERIYDDVTDEEVFWHRYQGLLLIPR